MNFWRQIESDYSLVSGTILKIRCLLQEDPDDYSISCLLHSSWRLQEQPMVCLSDNLKRREQGNEKAVVFDASITCFTTACSSPSSTGDVGRRIRGRCRELVVAERDHWDCP